VAAKSSERFVSFILLSPFNCACVLLQKTLEDTPDRNEEGDQAAFDVLADNQIKLSLNQRKVNVLCTITCNIIYMQLTSSNCL